MSTALRGGLSEALPEPLRELLASVTGAAEAQGARLHAVGGPVRDLLLGRPLRDVDLIVEAEGGWSAERVARIAAPRSARVVVHDRFGTVRIVCEGVELDLATTRRESYPRPGALPQVEAGSLEEDLRRRDFSVNALAIPLTRPAAAGRPELIDLGGGRRDLDGRTLRVFHERSFHDDPTRALRAARLAARLGFRLSRGSLTALRDALRDGAFGAVSGDRFRREIEKLFGDTTLGQEPQHALRRLADWHVLGALEPGLDLPRRAVAPLRVLGRALAQPPWPSGRLRPWAAGLTVWLAGCDTTVRRRTLRRLSVRGELAHRVVDFPRQKRLWLGALERARGRGAVDAILRSIEEERLHALHAWAPPALRRRVARWATEDRGKRNLVSGTELTALGLSGPEVGEALARIRLAMLDGVVRDREEALTLANEIARTAARRRARARSRSGSRGGSRRRERCRDPADRP